MFFSKKNQIIFSKAKDSQYKPTCSYCCKKGYTKFACPYRRNNPHIIGKKNLVQLKEYIKKNWVVKGTKPLNMTYSKYD